MTDRHPSHPASRIQAARAAVPRSRHRLGGLLRWDESDIIERVLRRAMALSMAVLLGLWPVMGTALAAEKTAEGTRVAALAPIHVPLEVAPPAFTLVTAGAAAHLAHDGAEVTVPPGTMWQSGVLSIRPLAPREVARMNPGLRNVTRGPRKGYRMEPSGHFTGEVTVTLPYDRKLLPEGMPDRAVGIYFFDVDKHRWTALRHVEVNGRDQTVSGRTDHFTDFVSGVVNVPQHPSVEGYTPTTFTGMKAADPGAKVNLIAPPQPSSSGDANLSYPIELPGGRNGLQPSLAVTYSSSRGNGWLGTGWGLELPSVDIDTRWGVPRYDTGQISGTPLETETYMLNGAELAPVANRGDLQPRTSEKSFSHRVEGDFSRIVRHGDSPGTYWWEVTAKDGTRSIFGGSTTNNAFDPSSVLRDPASGNIGRWMLSEVIDRNNNNIKFYYDIVDLTANGPEPARQIYPNHIAYTGRTDGSDGPYQIAFTRAPGRSDPIVDGRFGFKTVMDQRLAEIDVTLPTDPSGNPLIRSYTFYYGDPGQFGKSLLRTIRQLGTDGIEFNEHNLSYFDEIGHTGTFDAGTALTAFGAPGSGTVPGGSATLSSGSGLVSDVNGTAFSGEGDSADQTHLYVGIALGDLKNLSAGAKVGGIADSSQVSALLIDLNGDGLVDQVMVSGGGVSWVKNTGTPGAPSFSATPQPVAGLGAIDQSSGFTFTAGGEIYAGAGSLGAKEMLDASFGQTSNSVYFTDANGDGLPDLVSGGAVLYNQGVDSNGNPVFAATSPTPLGGASPAAAPNTTGLIQPPSDPQVAAKQQAAALSAFAVVDSVRRWVAPYTGTINVTGQVALTQAPPAGDTGADGVRAAVQLEDSELFSVTISDPTDLTPKPLTGLTGIAVTAGQRLYFRVNSRNDGAYDTVSFDPTISYTAVNGSAVDPTTLDDIGLPLYVTTASSDFAFGGRPLTVTAPANGTATITGSIVKSNVTTDDVTFVITQNGTPVFSQVIPAASTTPAGGMAISLPTSPLTLNQNDQFVARITSDTRINLSGILFTPNLGYQTINGSPAPVAGDGTPRLALVLPATAQVFGTSASGTPQTAYTAPGGQVEVTQTVSGAGAAGVNGTITLAASSGGVVLGKQVVSIVNGAITGPATLDVVLNLPAGTPVYFTADVSSAAILQAFTVAAPTDSAGNVLPSDTEVDTSAADPFAGGYRNWWYGDYTPADKDGTAPIDQTVLRFPTSATDPVFGRFAGSLPNEAGTPAVQITTASQVLPRWQARSANAFAAGGLMGSTRLGNRVPTVFDGTGFAGTTAVTKAGSSTNLADTTTFTMGLSFGGGTANGTNGTDIDFFDANGDGYPDVVSGNSIQPTLPNGALGSQRIALATGVSQVRQSTTSSVNVSLGATVSMQRTDANGFVLGLQSEQPSYNTTFSVNGGAQASWGQTNMGWDLIDVNADGLPDLVRPTGGGINVQLNLGYRFGQLEFWSASGYGGPVRQSKMTSVGFSAGASLGGGSTDAQYGFGGGGSSTQSQTATEYDLIDVNGDGLPDLVSKPLDPSSNPPTIDTITSGSTGVTVSLNSGAGFLPPQTWNGALPVPIQGRSSVNRDLGLVFTVSFPLPDIANWVIINPGFYHGDTFGGSRSQVRDFDGDGYADHIALGGSDGTVSVNLNQHGKTNLLKTITRPLGATIALDYTRAGNTTDLPQNHWVMSSLTVDDGVAAVAGDVGVVSGAAHTQLSTFAYQNGKWDRAERTFYGFATVTEQEYDTAQASQPVVRTITETFLTDSFYTRGLLTQSVTRDGAGNPFLETDHTYNVVTVTAGMGGNLADFTDVRFPQLTQRNKLFYEGQPTAGEQTSETFAYDSYGNVINYADLGDTGTADDVFSTIGYSASDPACVANYIVGIANSVTVTDTSGNVLRKRQADVNCTTANITENRRYLADGSISATDMGYDGEGKLTSLTGPANLNNERYSLTYTYDTTVDVYVESVTDSFDYISSSTHDYRFGEVLTSTDENAQVISNGYDTVGRLISVIGPYQQAAGTDTIHISYPDTLVPPAGGQLPIPSAKTTHLDNLLDSQLGGSSNLIETVLFTDGLKRVLQTKKDAYVLDPSQPQGGTNPAHVMTVSGRVVFDALGRTIDQYYPVTEALGSDTTFNPAFDAVRPTKTAYDVLDRVISLQVPDNDVDPNTGYDKATTTYDFGADRSGQTRFRTTVIDFNGVKSEQYHDVRAQITTVNEFNNKGATVYHTSYAYDPVRQITGVTDDQGNVTSVSYDLFGRRTAINSPDAGLTTFTYDLADNLTAKQTANLAAAGQQVTFGYQFNRVISITYPNFPGNNVAYTYGAASQRQSPASLTGNVVGRITHIVDGAGTEDRLYGPLGEIVSETRAIPIQGNQVGTYTTQFTYDTWNRVSSMVYPDQGTGEVVTYTYDFGGLPYRVNGNDDQLETDYASNILYDKFGSRLSLTNGNGATSTWAYRPDNRRVLEVTATVSGYTFHDLKYVYDAVGNVTSLQNAAEPPAKKNSIGGPWSKTYGYDDLYRLTSSIGCHDTSASGCLNSPPTGTYMYNFSQSYDSIHNITHKTQSATQNSASNPQTTYDFAYSYPAPGSPHPHGPTAIGPYTVSNDADGNQVNTVTTGTSDQNEYVYDEENRLACTNKGPQTPSPSCSSQGDTSFIYDHEGMRKVKSQSSPVIYPNQYYVDFGGGNGNQFKNVYIGSERILTKKARVAPDREHWYYHTDNLHSTGMVTDEKGDMIDAVHYFPFGEVWLEEVPASLPVDYFFTAKELDSETGLYDFGKRYFNPALSMWMTADPALGDYLSGTAGGPYVPSNMASYTYARSNPATLRDPDGRIVPLLVAAAAFAYGSYSLFAPDYANAPGPNDQIKTQSTTNQIVATVGGAAAAPLLAAGVEAAALQFAVRAPVATNVVNTVGAIAADAPVPVVVAGAATAKVATTVAGNVWKLGPGPRGQAIEQALEQNLPRNFPVIDRFEKGIATSIKSIDLDMPSYLTGNNLRNILARYVDKVADFNGRVWAGRAISSSEISGRALDVVVPHSGTAAQQATLDEIVKYGLTKGVTVNVIHYP